MIWGEIIMIKTELDCENCPHKRYQLKYNDGTKLKYKVLLESDQISEILWFIRHRYHSYNIGTFSVWRNGVRLE